jgi:hypothetical protein
MSEHDRYLACCCSAQELSVLRKCLVVVRAIPYSLSWTPKAMASERHVTEPAF